MSARILVVDDILPNVKLLEAKLKNEYYNVLCAYSGAEALEIIKNEKPDMVLLDVMMPEMDGFEVCRRIKNDPETEHIPVVMVTALTDAADRVNGLEAGADDFLTKPLDDVALMARVRSLIRLKMTMDEWRARENTATTLGVIEDIAKDNDVQLLYSDTSDMEFISIYGKASIETNEGVLKEFYHKMDDAWFDGVDDPNLTAIKVVPKEAYFWDNKQNKFVTFLKIGASAVTGDKKDIGEKGKLNL